jgi:colanic acid/amylovoran biosynthesis protein
MDYSLLIVNAHWNNRGDEAAIRAMLDSLRSKIALRSVRMMLLTKEAAYFPFKDVTRLDLFPYPARGPRMILLYLLDILSLFSFGRLTFTKRGKEYLQAVSDADIVIHAPGGPMIGDLYGSGLSELFELLRLYIPMRKNKPVFFYAPSMGPFSRKIMNRVRRAVIKKASLVAVREERSAKYLREQLGVTPYVTADSAFQNTIPNAYLQTHEGTCDASEVLDLAEQHKLVGMSLLDVRWLTYYHKNDALQEAIERSAKTLVNWLTAKGYFILIIPQLFGLDYEMPLLQRFRTLNREQIRILDNTCDAYAQQVIISKLFAYVTFRYHPAIFASKSNVPTLCIFYEHKMRGLMEKLGRSDLTMSVEDVDDSQLIQRFTYLEDNYNVIKHELAEANGKMKGDAERTTKLIIERIS